MIGSALFARVALSRPGLVALTIVGGLVLYEGLPVGPVARLPLVGPVVERIAAGRVDRVRLAAIEAARVGFVREAEKRAAEAELAETRRQLAASTAAREAFATDLAALRLAAEAAVATLETEIADYEKRLEDAGRACLLDRRDLEWLRRD